MTEAEKTTQRIRYELDKVFEGVSKEMHDTGETVSAMITEAMESDHAPDDEALLVAATIHNHALAVEKIGLAILWHMSVLASAMSSLSSKPKEPCE